MNDLNDLMAALAGKTKPCTCAACRKMEKPPLTRMEDCFTEKPTVRVFEDLDDLANDRLGFFDKMAVSMLTDLFRTDAAAASLKTHLIGMMADGEFKTFDAHKFCFTISTQDPETGNVTPEIWLMVGHEIVKAEINIVQTYRGAPTDDDLATLEAMKKAKEGGGSDE